jgi:hypothetical protein
MPRNKNGDKHRPTTCVDPRTGEGHVTDQVLRTLSERGWRIFPCRAYDDRDKPKAPLVGDNLNAATSDIKQTLSWWRRWPNAMIGLVPASAGWVVLDMKADVDYPDLPAAWCDSRIVRTPSRSLHVYFQAELGVDYGNGHRPDLGPLVDVIRHRKGYVVVPPSPGYALERDVAPIKAPAELALPAKSTPTDIVGESSAIDDREVIPAGEQEAAIHERAFHIARIRPRLSQSEAVAMLWQFIQDRCPNAPAREPWTREHAVDKVTRAFAVEIESPLHVDERPIPRDVAIRPLPDLLTDVERQLRRFVYGDDAIFAPLALWIAHTHAYDAFDTTPYLHVYSPAPQCGKTRLLEVVEMMAARAISSTSLTGPSLFRTIEDQKPTLMLDEVDNLFRGRSADLAGGDWPRRLRGDLVCMFEHAAEFALSTAADIVRDALSVYVDGVTVREHMSGDELRRKLNERADLPYQEMNDGRGISVRDLIARLAAYEVKPLRMHHDGTRTRVYRHADLQAVLDRYAGTDADHGPGQRDT